MSNTLYYIISAVLSIGVLYGIKLMSDVKTATNGNRLSALCMLVAIVVTLVRTDVQQGLVFIILGLLIGTLLSIYMTVKVKMIQMPQMVGLLNGLGGLASSIAAILTVAFVKNQNAFELTTAGLAMAVGAITFSGSLVAALKLHGKMPQKPIVLPGHRALSAFSVIVIVVLVVLIPAYPKADSVLLCALLGIVGLVFGWLFAIRVGGADMPITISLLNSTSGVAAAIAGMALGDVLLVAVGGIVGSSGLLLTQIMCRAMNRKLGSILFGGGKKPSVPVVAQPVVEEKPIPETIEETIIDVVEETPVVEETKQPSEDDLGDWITDANKVIIIPGYGMALSQAQDKVKQLMDQFQSKGKQVRFAIHPVAGRMPGHMNVLLAEVDIPYEMLFEMDDINADFKNTDLVIVIGANDVVNPAANTAEGTPIYGMPILDASEARRLIICNFDTKPGYAGVDNPLYEGQSNVLLLLGDAKDSLDKILAKF